MIKLSDYGFQVLQIETYGLCNMECGFCPYPSKSENAKTSKLEDSLIKKIIDEVDPKDEKFRYVTFSQFNEPLLDKRIFEFIEYAKNKGLEVYFITNGLLLDKKRNIDKLIELNPVIKISLQILDDSKHRIGRGLNLDLEKYIAKIKSFIEIAKNTKLNVTVDVGSNFNDSKTKFILKKLFGFSTGDPNIPYTSQETLFFLEKYFKSIFDSKSDLNFLKDNKKINNNYLSQEGIKITENITIKIKHFHYGNKIRDYKPINNNFKCPSTILAIQSGGEVEPCCLSYDNSISLGKINDKSLKEILDGNVFLKNLRKKNGEKHITCRKCFGEPTNRGVFFRNLVSHVT